MVYITKGTIAVGFRLFNDLSLVHRIKNHIVIGDYDCMHQRVSEFLYQPVDYARGFSLRRNYFLEIL